MWFAAFLSTLAILVVAKKDYYQILGVKRNANDAELKRAFRKKSMQWHPDKHTEKKESTFFLTTSKNGFFLISNFFYILF